MVTQRFRLDIVPGGGAAHEAHVSQHDAPVHFEVELHASAGELAIPGTAQASLEGTLASGEKVTGVCTRSGMTVRFDLPAAVTGEMGRHVMGILLSDGGKELRSSLFAVCVEGDPVLL